MIALFKNLLSLRGIHYLTLDTNLCIVEVSENVDRYSDMSHCFQLGKSCFIGLPELVGTEAHLLEIAAGERLTVQLENIARTVEDGSLIFFDLYALQCKGETFANSSIILFIEDVTRRLCLEQSLVQGTNEMSLLLSALETSKAYTDRIHSAMADALFVTDSTGIIKLVNTAAEQLFEYPESELIGQSLSMLVADPNFIYWLSHSETVALRDEEVICRAKQGRKMTISFSRSTVPSEIESKLDFLYIGRDITERQRSQQRFMAQYTTAGILSKSSTLTSAIAQILPSLCQSLEWDIAELWMLKDSLENADSSAPMPIPELHCAEIWSRQFDNLAEFIAITRNTTFAIAEGLPGKVWQCNAPMWIQDVADNTDFLRTAIAVKFGIHTAFGFPIYAENQVLGVVTFFSQEVRLADTALLRSMAVIGNQLGEFVQRKQAEIALVREQQRNEYLLRSVFPQSIAEQLKQQQREIQQDSSTWHGIAECFDEATVLFGDLVGFTQLTTQLPPNQLVNLLNQVFSAFDRLTERHGLEKIKTIGDAYMVVGGVPNRRHDHAQAVANMALDMQQELTRFNQLNHQTLEMRIGIDTGSVIAGVIGIKKFIYDLWGNTVNTASRMESHGITGQIHVSAATFERLKHDYVFQPRGCILVKGKGDMTTYLLKGKRANEGNNRLLA